MSPTGWPLGYRMRYLGSPAANTLCSVDVNARAVRSQESGFATTGVGLLKTSHSDFVSLKITHGTHRN